MRKLLALTLAVLILLCGCQKNETVETDFQSPLSDDVNTRFEQLFYNELDAPTIEKPDFRLNSSGSGSSAPPCHSFKTAWFKEQGLAQGAFYFIEPPYSDVAVGVDRSVIRGIYNMSYTPIETIDKKAEKSSFPVRYDSTYHSFSIDYEAENCTLHDLILTLEGSSLTEQNIPLLIDGSHIEVDFSQVPEINGSVGTNCPFTLSGILTYEGVDYPFKTSF